MHAEIELGSDGHLSTYAPRPFQRLMDIVIAGMASVILVPLAIVIAISIWSKHGMPIVFGHRRIGREGKPFVCYKFRTMVNDSESVLQCVLEADPQARTEWNEHRKLRNDPRVLGKLGQTLRRFSVDELPQICNVLYGDMSLVGPRPVSDAELSYYGQDVVWYLAVRPGITGAWQISGRSDTSYEKRVALDVDYAKNANTARYLGILFRTPGVVLCGGGAY